MVLPIYQQRNQRPQPHQPNPMYRSPNPYMYPQQFNNSRGNVGGSGTNKIQQMLQRFVQPSAGGVGGNIASRGAGGLSNTLGNVQQVLKVVQSTAPMIQEYGPMVKNIPAMYRMMKAIKDVDHTDEDKDEDIVKEEVNQTKITEPEPSKSIKASEEIASKPKKVTGQSTPKLFI